MRKPKDQKAIFEKLDRLQNDNVDYLEHLLGMIQESDPKSKEWKNLIVEFENILYNYDAWMEDRNIIWSGKW